MTDSLAINLDGKQKHREVKTNMSVYNYDYKWLSFRGFFRNLKQFFVNRRMAKQRAKRGYCDRDIWNCGNSMLEYMLATIAEYRNTTNFWPDQYFTTFDMWIAYLDEIIDHLEYALTDPDELNGYLDAWEEQCRGIPRSQWTEEQENIWQNYLDAYKEIDRRQTKARESALGLLAPYMPHIWW